MHAISDSAHLIQLDWSQICWKDADRPDDVSRETITQLTAYFTGQFKAFTIPLRLAGVTRHANIDLMSWPASILGPPSAMPHLPPPEGTSKAARAAGTACVTNPIPIIYPCHRVVRKNGTLRRLRWGQPVIAKPQR